MKKILLLLLLLPALSWGANNTWTIAPSGGDDTSLDFLFDHADTTISSGDTLFVDITQTGVDSLTATKALDGWTNNGVIYVRAIESARHDGVYDESAYVLVKGFTTTLNIGQAGIVIFEGIQFRQGTFGANSYTYFDEATSASDVTFKECIFAGNYRLLNNFGNGLTSHWKFYNCLFQDFSSGTIIANGGCTLSVYNCTFSNCNQAVVAISSADAIIKLKNTIAIHQASANGAFFSASSGGTWDVDYCITDDGTADDFGVLNNQVNTTPVMVDTVNDTFLLASGDTYAIDNGVSLGDTITIDVQGEARSTIDIGFDEYVVAGTSETVIRWLNSISGVFYKAAPRKDYKNAP